MSAPRRADWDPTSADVQADQIAAYDHMRRTCPVAYGTSGNWALFSHSEVVRVLDDHHTYSNVVSEHQSVPNGMDPPQHTAYRALVNRYYTADRMWEFEPKVRAIAAELIAALPRDADVDVMADLGEPLATRAQCASMGWPPSLHEPLREWTKQKHAATHAQDRAALSAVARAFDGYIRAQLDIRRAAGTQAPADPTTRLLGEQVDGRALTDDEIVSIVRNWTVGELATIAASVGIIAWYLATHPDVQDRLRGDVSSAERASDEILRMHAPLIANRRRTTTAVNLGGREIPEQERLLVVWAAANRDEAVFGDPDEFRLDRDPDLNLLYGRGIHACPGAPLARLELRVLMDELFARTTRITPAQSGRPVNAVYPAAGFATLPLRFG